jgi:hypothetical protein
MGILQEGDRLRDLILWGSAVQNREIQALLSYPIGVREMIRVHRNLVC